MASKCSISTLKIKSSNTHATSSVSTVCVQIHVVHIRKISPYNSLLFHFVLHCSVVYNGEFAVGYPNWIHFIWGRAWESVPVTQLIQSGHSVCRDRQELNWGKTFRIAYSEDFEALTSSASSLRFTLEQFAVLIQKWHLGFDPKKLENGAVIAI